MKLYVLFKKPEKKMILFFLYNIYVYNIYAHFIFIMMKNSEQHTFIKIYQSPKEMNLQYF